MPVWSSGTSILGLIERRSLREVDHLVQGLNETRVAPVPDRRLELGGVGGAPRHLLEALAVHLLERYQPDSRRRAGPLDDQVRKIADLDLFMTSHIEHLTLGLGNGHQLDQSLHYVVDAREG